MAQAPPSDIFTRRVCLQLDGMDAVSVRRDVAYGPPDRYRCMDVYYPSDEPDDDPFTAPTVDRRWPAVIIVAGYPETIEPRVTPLTYKEIGWTVSMCQLIAVSGMVAIAYTNRDPVADLRALFEHVHECAGSLRIDPRMCRIVADRSGASRDHRNVWKRGDGAHHDHAGRRSNTSLRRVQLRLFA
jgi:hypothetical protein